MTTQINIDGDPYLHDDFAYATHDDLIPAVIRKTDAADINAAGLNAPFAEIYFDFALAPAQTAREEELHDRSRALAG